MRDHLSITFQRTFKIPCNASIIGKKSHFFNIILPQRKFLQLSKSSTYLSRKNFMTSTPLLEKGVSSQLGGMSQFFKTCLKVFETESEVLIERIRNIFNFLRNATEGYNLHLPQKQTDISL